MVTWNQAAPSALGPSGPLFQSVAERTCKNDSRVLGCYSGNVPFKDHGAREEDVDLQDENLAQPY